MRKHIIFIAFMLKIVISNAQNNFSNPTETKTLENEFVVLTFNNQFKNHLDKTPTELRALYDSIYNWGWDLTAINWASHPRSKTINMVYDANQNLIAETYQNWNGHIWINARQDFHSYDTNNNLTSYLYQNWDTTTTAWVDDFRMTVGYDTVSNKLSELSESWKNGYWLPNYQRAFTYDANHNQISSYTEDYQYASIRPCMVLSVYDTNNNQLSSLYQNLNNNVWVNDKQYLSTYDTNNNLTNYVTQNWSNGIGVWNNFSKSIYTYDGNHNRTSTLLQNGNGAGWVNASYYTYVFNANNKLTNGLWQTWDTSGFWVSASKSFRTYDNNNNEIKYLGQDLHNGLWTNRILYSTTYANNFKNSFSAYMWSDSTTFSYGDSSYYFLNTQSANPCFASFSISFDSTQNTFDLTVDSISVAKALDYYWNFGDGTTSTLPTPTHAYTKDSLYNLCMTLHTIEGDSCTYCHFIGVDTSGNIIRNGGFTLNVHNNSITTNISQSNLNENNIVVYPNPFNLETTILFSKEIKNTKVGLVDILGIKINEINFTGKQLIIEKGEMKNGIYFLQIIDDNNNIVNRKIIIN
jgi:hypothetical protein